MKRKLFSLCMVVSCLAILTSGTLAYFTAEERTHNVITSGSISIDIIEKQMDNSGVLVDFPQDGIFGMMPGEAVSKIVSVKNDGGQEAWIRIKVEKNIKNPEDKTLPLEIDTGTGSVPVMWFDVDIMNWVKGADDYYYYKYAVAPGGMTKVLFDEIHFAPQMGNEYLGCTAHIIVSAQAVQAANNPIPAGGDVTDVKGWPKEVGEE